MVDQDESDMMTRRIRARRDELAAHHAAGRLQYAELEEHIKQQQEVLIQIQRNLDAMHGGLQELEALLGSLEEPTP